MGMNQMDMGMMPNEMDSRERMRKAGDRIDFEIESVMAIELPQGRFSERMLNKLVDTLNKFAPMMEFESIERVSGEQTQFPMELLQMVMAIAAAAEDAGMAIEINLSEMEADRDLASVIGQLDKLSRDAKFKKFLTEEIFPEAEEAKAEEEEGEEAEEAEEEEEEDDDLDEMFARRM
jgi:TATA-binding protein-associated factor Taf7